MAIPTGSPRIYADGLIYGVFHLTRGVSNTRISDLALRRAEAAIPDNPFYYPRLHYEVSRDSMAAKWFKVFDPISHNGQTIDPKVSIDAFFDTAETLYASAVQRTFDILEYNVKGRADMPSSSEWKQSFSSGLESAFTSAQEIAVWAAYASQRKGIVGSRIRRSLADVGITDPTQLPHDVKTIGNNVVEFYDRFSLP